MANHDIERSEGEGMFPIDPKEAMSDELKSFLEEIEKKFKSDGNMWGVREAANAVIQDKMKDEAISEDDKIKFIESLKRDFSLDKSLTVEKVEKFFQGSGGDVLKDNMRTFLGEQEWDKFEKTGAVRNLRHDQTFGGTPG